MIRRKFFASVITLVVGLLSWKSKPLKIEVGNRYLCDWNGYKFNGIVLGKEQARGHVMRCEDGYDRFVSLEDFVRQS